MKNKNAQALGSLGGKAGKGKSKVRGDAEYYRRIAMKRNESTILPEKKEINNE